MLWPLLFPATLFITCLYSPALGLPIRPDDSIEALAQLIVSHWHFEHIEPIAASTHRIITQTFLNEHLVIEYPDTTASLNNEQIDLTILHAQVVQAMQSHIEGALLPDTWDRLIQPHLERGPLQAQIAQLLKTPEENDTDKTAVIDNLILEQLHAVLNEMSSKVAPDLLNQAAQELEVLLANVNEMITSPAHHFRLQIARPWTDTHSQAIAERLVNELVIDDDHAVDFFSSYRVMVQATNDAS